MPSPFTRILVGWDGSSGAVKGLHLALQLSAGSSGRVTALAVVPTFAHVEDATARDRALDDVRTPLRDAFDAVLRTAQPDDHQRVSLEFTEGVDPGKAFEHYSALHPIELVVVGLHGREGLLHPKMGHVASHAIHVSRCPVLVVPETDGAVPSAQLAAEHGSRLSTLFHPFRNHEATP